MKERAGQSPVESGYVLLERCNTYTSQSARCVGQERVLRRRGEDRKSKSPPCRRKRDKDGAPSGVQMKERAGQPPTRLLVQERRHPCDYRFLFAGVGLVAAVAGKFQDFRSRQLGKIFGRAGGYDVIVGPDDDQYFRFDRGGGSFQRARKLARDV